MKCPEACISRMLGIRSATRPCTLNFIIWNNTADDGRVCRWNFFYKRAQKLLWWWRKCDLLTNYLERGELGYAKKIIANGVFEPSFYVVFVHEMFRWSECLVQIRRNLEELKVYITVWGNWSEMRQKCHAHYSSLMSKKLKIQ